MTKNTVIKRAFSLLISLILIISCFPMAVFAEPSNENPYFNRIIDNNTMNGWKKYFDLSNLDTTNAGGVWTDKSVVIDPSVFNNSDVTMINPDENFLTVLSAIASNKEVVGYSTIPTDTVIILDLSNSMSQSDVTQLVAATNNAIKTLNEANNNNRVGVVLYSGSSSNRSYSNAVTRLMPIDRYSTTDRNGNFINYQNGVVSVDNDVSGSKQGISFGQKAHSGATYIQAGLWEAWKMFSEVPDSEIIIGEDNWQSGEYRMPIVVLMSDGAPTLGASKFYDVENSTYGSGYQTTYGADVGNGNDSGITAGQGFLVQLTASYIKNQIENKYKVKSENGTGRSLFYTLGFNISADNDPDTVSSGDVAYSVLNPDASAITDSLWQTYNAPETTNMQVRVKSRSTATSSYMNVSITKNSYATSKSYVDEYFPATSNNLTEAFKDIVEEIILQSRYYPTHLEGGSPDFSGYVEFTDILGEYMEVKQINGILFGNTLFDGRMMASKLADSSMNGLGTPENPTTLGDEFIRAVKTRLGIADTATAQQLVKSAYEAGQLSYITDGNGDLISWSNYIGWYATKDGTFIKHWNENANDTIPVNATYRIKSYGFLGETTGSIKNSDMMYMSVQVKTEISTGIQTVTWKIPAALVPMITYMVALDGINVDTATNVRVTVDNASQVSPIRLVYETGIRSDLNEFNITNITDENHIADDGYTRIFWNNYFDISAETHDEHITTIAAFTPNKENEHFYYPFDSAVHKKIGNSYVLVGSNETLDENGEYYHRRYVFKEGESNPIFLYEKISSKSIKVAKENGWQEDFKTLDNQRGAWVVPKGTPARELQMYDEEKSVNKTKSANMVFHPYITESNNIFYVDMNLGNNGLLSITPATGIKISKTVDIFEAGTSDTFRFRITANVSGSFEGWVTAIGETPSGEPTTVTFTNGVYEFDLKKDQTFWINELPAGTNYTVEEISENDDYKVKSVHVNGKSTGKTATGTVAKYLVDDIDFVNTAISEGNLVITKKVVDATGNIVDVNDNLEFTIEVTLITPKNEYVTGTFDTTDGALTISQDGKFRVKLSDGESFVIRGIPEETQYTVKEIDIPVGFEFNETASKMNGVIDTTTSNQAVVVNTYAPTGTTGNEVSVLVTKEISGSRTQWLNGESYTFVLERVNQPNRIIATKTISSNDVDKSFTCTLTSEQYLKAGTYYYRITEQSGTQGGITYDTAERRFAVVVADDDMDGTLNIVSVDNGMNTVVSGNWLVTAHFNNVYKPGGSATATINIKKEMLGNHSLSGYQFALYDTAPSTNDEADELVRSGITDAYGSAAITLNYSPSDVGNTYTYYLAEINRGETINNIKYSQSVYKVTITVTDNLDGTISANMVVYDLPTGETVPVFINEYVPSESDFITISGKKEIDGNRVLNAGEFEFAITAVTEGAPMPSELVVKNSADGSFAFPSIEFSDVNKGNTYEYRVYEISDSRIGGFEYDTTVYTVTVNVIDNADQTISASVVINNGAENVDNIVFVNAYDAKDAEVVLQGTKLLVGKSMRGEEFEFILDAVTPNAPMPTAAIVTNTADGRFEFGKIVFDKAGTYVYKITEKDGGIENYIYDKSVYVVTITVTDNSQGVLYAEIAMKKNNMNSQEIVFRNSFIFTAISCDVYENFGGKKILSGRELQANEFKFVLINARNGEQIDEIVRNDADGKFILPNVSLSADGVYHFKIVEVVGDDECITYDTSSFHIRIEVAENEDGALEVVDRRLYKGVVSKQEVGGVITEVTTYEDITVGGTIEFNNIYQAKATELVIEGTKILEGRSIEVGEFEFELYDENNVKLETVAVSSDGTFNFSGISVFGEGEYVYTVRETQGSDQNITYDTSVYTVTAVVTDNLDGTFAVEYTYLKGEESADSIVFRNVYTNPYIPDTGDHSNINLWLALWFVSGVIIFGSVLCEGKRRLHKRLNP